MNSIVVAWVASHLTFAMPAGSELHLAEQIESRVTEFLGTGPRLPLHPAGREAEDEEALSRPCEPEEIHALLAHIREDASAVARSAGPTEFGRAIMEMQGPEGSGRFWRVRLVAQRYDGTVQSLCLETSTRGYLYSLGVAKTRLARGELPTLTDLDGDGRVEVVLWGSWAPAPEDSAPKEACPAPPLILLPKIYRITADALVPAPNAGASLHFELAAIYAELAGAPASSCAPRDARHETLLGTSTALEMGTGSYFSPENPAPSAHQPGRP